MESTETISSEVIQSVTNVMKNFNVKSDVNLIVNFNNKVNITLDNFVNIHYNDLKYRKEDVGKLILVFPITFNKFSFIEQLKSILKLGKLKVQEIIIFEVCTMKVQGFIQDLPIFQGYGVNGVYDSLGNICRIVWSPL